MFDNPIIWIAIIWWLVTSFLSGKKKRRRRPEPAQEAQNLYAEESGNAEYELAPDAYEPAPDPEPVVTQPEPVPDPLAAQPEPAPVLQQRPRTLQDLARMWQGLDVEFSGGERAVEPEPEPPPPPPEPVAVPVEPPPDSRRRHEHTRSAVPGRRPRMAPALRLTAGLAARFTPLQEAIIYREIFDRPRSKRRSRPGR